MYGLMPVTFLAHQAPVLPLKRWRTQLDGVAMVAGTITPDLARTVPPRWALIVDGYPIWWDGHAPVQALTGGLLVGLLLTWTARRLVLPRLAGLLPDLGRFHLRDLRLLGRTRHRWWVIVAGVVIGTVTHLLLDLVTHTDREVVIPGLGVHLFDVGRHHVQVATILQVIATVGLSILAVWEMWDIGRRRLLSRWSGVDPSPAPPPPHAVAVRTAVVTAAVVSVAVGATQMHRTATTALMTVAVVGWTLLCVIAVFVRPSPLPSDEPVSDEPVSDEPVSDEPVL